MRVRALLIMLALLCAGGRAQADQLRWSWAIDGSLTAAGGVGWLVAEYFAPQIVSNTCRWCESDGAGHLTANAFDRGARDALHWSDRRQAHNLSLVGSYIVAPAATFVLELAAARQEDQDQNLLPDALLIFESVIVASDLNQALRLTTGRERPYVGILPADLKQHTGTVSENNASFFSGHTSLGFSMAVASGTIASLRHYRLAPWVWGIGLTAATGLAYLRMAADDHWASDVVVGALVGSAVGFAVPYLHRRRIAVMASATPEASLAGVAFTW